MLKFLIGAFLALTLISASAFTSQECQIAAQNVYSAQNLLNEDPAAFKEVHARVKAAPPEAMDWSKELKSLIMGVVDRLKPGADAEKLAIGVFEACKSIKNV